VTKSARLRLAGPGAGVIIAAVVVVAAAQASSGSPRPSGLSCLERCAGRSSAAVGSIVTIAGRGLANVVRVDFRGHSARIPAKPRIAGRHHVVVKVPRRAQSGRPRVTDGRGHSSLVPRILRVVPGKRIPPRGSFDLLDSAVRPHSVFIDGGHALKLRYRFRAYGTKDVMVKLVRHGHVVRRWKEPDRLSYTPHLVRWNGMLANHHAASRGHYRFKIKAPGHHALPTPRFRLLDGKFPVRGPHDYGGAEQRFGAPRSGGRVHQGQDVFAACGTRVVAARGGRVQARGYDPVLYGNWIVIDARGTHTDYRYAHFLHPATVHDGDRVRTGDTVAQVGKTGNARSVGCMLHLEVWPHGWENRNPIDPLPILKRWDGWS
jgi:hypothetical protein